jgi:hypothetical protein
MCTIRVADLDRLHAAIAARVPEAQPLARLGRACRSLDDRERLRRQVPRGQSATSAMRCRTVWIRTPRSCSGDCPSMSSVGDLGYREAVTLPPDGTTAP